MAGVDRAGKRVRAPRPGSLGDAAARALDCGVSVSDWARQAHEALAEAEQALVDGRLEAMVTASRALHYVMGMVAGSPALLAVVRSGGAGIFYPTLYKAQDRLVHAMQKKWTAAGLSGAQPALGNPLVIAKGVYDVACTDTGGQAIRAFFDSVCIKPEDSAFARAIKRTAGGMFTGGVAPLACAILGREGIERGRAIICGADGAKALQIAAKAAGARVNIVAPTEPANSPTQPTRAPPRAAPRPAPPGSPPRAADPGPNPFRDPIRYAVRQDPDYEAARARAAAEWDARHGIPSEGLDEIAQRALQGRRRRA